MIKKSRKLTFQLTPLLDLFLIVIFAQYLEMQETSAKAEANIRLEANKEISNLQSELKQEQNRLNSVRKDLVSATLRSSEIEKQLNIRYKEWKSRLKEVLEQQDDTGDLIAELFQVPEDILNEAINQTVQESPKRSEEEIARLKKTFQDLAKKRGRETIVHLLTFEEMRKRMDLWEVFIEENGEIRLNAGKEKFDFKATTEKEFSDKLFSCYKSMQEPKSLVIILLSYGNTRSGIRRAAIKGLPLASVKMQQDSLGRSRFDYAILGYYPKPQLDQNDE
jgi:uncharacterized membrane-anchored protein YhcB (DUF1043 family)